MDFNEIINSINKPDSQKDWKTIEKSISEIDINATTPSGETLLFYLIKNKAPINIVNAVLELGLDPNKIEKNASRTCAYFTQDISILASLIKYGLDVNLTDVGDLTLAHYNITNLDVLKLAIESGLDLDIEKRNGRNIAYSVIEEERIKPCEQLRLLQTKGLDLNKVDNSGLSPLHYAVVVSNLSAFECLIKLGVNTDIKTTKEFNWDWGGQPNLLIQPNSSVADLVKEYDNWAQTATDNVGGEWIDEKRYEIEKYKELLIPPASNNKKWWQF